MMVRPTPRVARLLTAASFGMLSTALLRVHTGIHGTGVQSILLLGVLVSTLVALGCRPVPVSKHWRFGLFAFSALSITLPELGQVLTTALHKTVGTTSALPYVLLAAVAITIFPMIRLGLTATRTGSGFGSSIWFAFGLLIAAISAPLALVGAIAAIGILFADHVASPERGWSKHDTTATPIDIGITALAGMWISSGWVHLRAVFDPTSFSVIAIVLGITLVRSFLGPNRNPPLIFMSILGGALWAVLGHIDPVAPRLAAIGFNGMEPGWYRTAWLALPFVSLGLGFGAFVRCREHQPLTWISFGVGLWLGPSVLTTDALLWASAGLAAVAALAAKGTMRQALAVFVAIGLVGIDGWLQTSQNARASTGIWSNSNSARNLALWATPGDSMTRGILAITPAGTLATWTVEQQEFSLAVTIDGLTRHTAGHLAKSEELAGHLAALLSQQQESVLVMGDEMGNALRGLASHPARIAQVAVPFPLATQFLANQDDFRRKLWMAPSTSLFPEHPATLLHRTPSVGAIVEVSHTPWASASDNRLDAHHLRTVKSRLTSDGVYILCVHLRYWPNNTVQAIANTLIDAFQSVQVWAPPEGADSLLFVASDSDLSYEQLAQRYAAGRTGLESLGFTSPETLAGGALLGTQGVKAWAGQHTSLPPADRLNVSIFEKPVLHMGSIAPWMEDTSNPWEENVPDGVAEVRTARKMMLELFQSAASGQLEGAFSAARKLSTEHGDIGEIAVQRLIEPHIKDARRAIAAARLEGPNSARWDDALRFATTAQLLAPNSAQPQTLLGDLAIARGQTDNAWKYFSKALDIDPTHVPALDGLAQCARLEKNPKKTEQALRKATRYAPRDWRTWHNLGVFYLETDELEQAMENIETAIGLASNDEVPPLLVLTEILLRKGDAGAALLRAEQCTQLAPDNGLSWYLRGRAHYDLNRFQEAENDFRKAVLTDSDLIEARGGLGMVRAVLGDPTAAIAAFKEVLTRDPNNGAARENLRRLQALTPDGTNP